MCIRIFEFTRFLRHFQLCRVTERSFAYLHLGITGYWGGLGEKSHVTPVTDDSGIRDPTYVYLTKLPEEQTNSTARSSVLCSTSYD